MSNENVNNTVLLNTFTIRNKRCKVYFHRGTLVWDNEEPPNSHYTLPMEDVICIVDNETRIIETSRSPFRSNTKDPNSFTIHYAKRNARNNVWRHNSVTMKHVDSLQVASWVTTLRNHLNTFKRPKNLLLFVNPYGGKKKALALFEKYGKPLFHLAGVDVSVLVSQHANQIKDMILSLDLRNYDGIACVGGDGTFSEVFNGLVLRTCRDQSLDADDIETILPRPALPVGVVPGGSTDTVAYCLHGTTDVQTAVLQIIFGDSIGLDLVSVYNEKSLVKLYASVLSYGYLGDIALHSENYRWMGPKRYEFTGFKKLLANTGYEGEIVLCPEVVPEQQNESSSLSLSEKCLASCSRCLTRKLSSTLSDSDKSVRTEHTDTESPSWKTVKGKFFMVSGANITCACARSPNGISPYCHVGDGCVDLVLVRHTSFFNNLRLLMRLSSKTKTVMDLPFVEIHRAKEFCFRACPRNSMGNEPQIIPGFSSWNCDGEVIQDTDLRAKVRCQLITVYSRGLQETKPQTSSCCGKLQST